MKKFLFLLAVLLIAAGMCVAQTGATSSTGANDQNSAATPSSSSANQGPASADQTPVDQSAGTAGQAGTNANESAEGNMLPQTASPLPLLAILGMSSLGAGLINRFRK